MTHITFSIHNHIYWWLQKKIFKCVGPNQRTFYQKELKCKIGLDNIKPLIIITLCATLTDQVGVLGDGGGRAVVDAKPAVIWGVVTVLDGLEAFGGQGSGHTC